MFFFLKAALKHGSMKTRLTTDNYSIGKTITFDSNQHVFECNVFRMSVT